MAEEDPNPKEGEKDFVTLKHQSKGYNLIGINLMISANRKTRKGSFKVESKESSLHHRGTSPKKELSIWNLG
jgi:hypothetical protein